MIYLLVAMWGCPPQPLNCMDAFAALRSADFYFESSEEEEYDVGKEIPKDAIYLSGTIVSDNSLCVVRFKKRTYILEIGDQVEGWFVNEITSKYVEFINDEGLKITVVDWYDLAGDEGTLNSGTGISPGSPQGIDAAVTGGTANSQQNYNPAGLTRFRAVGLVSAFSGADGAGGDASPACPVSAMSQVVAQPFFVDDSGAGDQSSVTIASPYVGTAKIYEWNSGTSSLDLAYTVPLSRSGVTVTTQDDQLHPAGGQVSNTTGNTNVVALAGDLNPGVIVADVPIMVVMQSNITDAISIRSQNGTTATLIDQQDDETLMFGITPESIAAEIREDADGILRRRAIDNTGAETWEVV